MIVPEDFLWNFCRKNPEIFVDIFEKERIISSCMDTIKDCRIPKCGDVPDLTGKQVVVGAKQLKKALKKGNIRYVYLAENADPAITEPIEDLCRQGSIHVTWISSMAELGRACGIEVGAAAAAVLNS